MFHQVLNEGLKNVELSVTQRMNIPQLKKSYFLNRETRSMGNYSFKSILNLDLKEILE